MIHAILDFLRSLTNPDQLIHLLATMLSGWLGYAVLCGLVFAETGLLVGVIVPGDSLLFTVGMVAGAGKLDIFVVNAVLMFGAMLGDSTGYLLGRQTGPRIFARKDSLIFKQEYVTRTKAFYERYGGKTILFARFLPIVRSFAAFMAGVGQMPYLRFLPFSICGGIGSVLFLTTLGYALGNVKFVHDHFDAVILLIVVLSLAPTAVHAVREWRKA